MWRVATSSRNAIEVGAEVRAACPVPFAWQTQDLHESGAVGDATQASAEKGEQLLDHGARAFCELLDDVDKFDPELFLRKA